MALVQITHVQNYQGQTMTNRYFYRTTLAITAFTLAELMDEFEAQVVAAVNQLQHNTVANERLDCVEIEGFVFSGRTLTGVGANSGDPSPSWNALSFKLQRTNSQVKSGGKRIGGISEANIIGNIVFPDPTYVGWIDDYCVASSAILTTASGIWTPVLIKFDPANPGVVLVDQLFSETVFTKLSTQNTRKPE